MLQDCQHGANICSPNYTRSAVRVACQEATCRKHKSVFMTFATLTLVPDSPPLLSSFSIRATPSLEVQEPLSSATFSKGHLFFLSFLTIITGHLPLGPPPSSKAPSPSLATSHWGRPALGIVLSASRPLGRPLHFFPPKSWLLFGFAFNFYLRLLFISGRLQSKTL